MPFHLAGVYGKGLTFPEILVPNSLLLHTIVLKNRFLFFGTFRKGNVPCLMRCEIGVSGHFSAKNNLRVKRKKDN